MFVNKNLKQAIVDSSSFIRGKLFVCKQKIQILIVDCIVDHICISL